jgi:ribosomal protein S2
MNMYFIYKISSSMLMGFGSHFGSLLPADWNADSSAFIHSRFHSRFLINLSFTSIMVTKALRFISFFVSRHLKFLYFFSEGFLRFLNTFTQSTYFWKFNFFLIDSWVSGTLTNYKVVQPCLDKLQNRTNLNQCPSGLIFLGEPKFLPIAAAEARISRFPSIGLADIDNGFSPFAYTIPSNNKTFGIASAYYRLFQCAAERGRALGYASYLDKVSSRFDLLINRALHIFYSNAPDIDGVRIGVTQLLPYKVKSRYYRQWWLGSLNKLPLKTFSYWAVERNFTVRRYARFGELAIDLAVSIQLTSSIEFLERLRSIEKQALEKGSRRYMRYLKRKKKLGRSNYLFR